MPRRSDPGLKTIAIQSSGGGVTLGVSMDVIDFAGLLERARDLRPVFDREKGRFTEASSYERPDRFAGGMGQPDKDGVSRNWGPGYRGSMRIGRTKRTMTARNRRPYMPRPTDGTVVGIAEATLEHIVKGGG